jgi:pyruvate,water dikinase
MVEKGYVLWFNETKPDQFNLVGGKNASLAKLENLGVKVPPGFSVTTLAYERFLEYNALNKFITHELSSLDASNTKQLRKCGKRIRDAIVKGKMPPDVAVAIQESYKKLELMYGRNILSCAVRSSATAEDLADASFAGQQETYLNVKGEKQILEKTKMCMASLFNDRAIFYRAEKGFAHIKVGLSVGIQKMVQSDVAGVMFTIEANSGNKNIMTIDANYGLGETVVSGSVAPDQFFIFKETGTPVNKKIGHKKIMTIYVKGGGVKTIQVPEHMRSKLCLSDEYIKQLAKAGLKIESNYRRPMDIEWAIEKGEVYIVQARPETVHSQKKTISEVHLDKKGTILVSGVAVGTEIGQGKTKVIGNVNEIDKLQKGEVLVARMTTPNWVPVMRKASAIITEEGGTTCHAAIVSRELGIPCVVGADNAMSILTKYEGKNITVDCSGGKGIVYEGILPYSTTTTDISKLKTKTRVMMNVSVPEAALNHAWKADGVGLLRMEFVYATDVGIHPLALLKLKELKSKARLLRRRKKPDKKLDTTIAEIDQRTKNYPNKSDFFIEKIANGIATIAAANYPHDTVVRFSDLKTNEYRGLLGGEYFEPEEVNPMLGWRGASRYTDKDFEPAFRLECKALKMVQAKGLKNIIPMVPFCRTVNELKRTIAIIGEEGLIRGKDNLRVFVMAEIPSNIWNAAEFCQYVDGFSIGSNDLTQFTLGVDRDNASLWRKEFDERDPAIKKSISHLIEIAHKYGKKVGICGQAPSDYPEIVEFLVKEGIDSISLNSDVLGKMKKVVAETERKLL